MGLLIIILCSALWVFLLIWPASLIDNHKNRHVRNICGWWLVIFSIITILFISIGIPLLLCN